LHAYLPLKDLVSQNGAFLTFAEAAVETNGKKFSSRTRNGPKVPGAQARREGSGSKSAALSGTGEPRTYEVQMTNALTVIVRVPSGELSSDAALTAPTTVHVAAPLGYEV
jgi:hypothetical protein